MTGAVHTALQRVAAGNDLDEEEMEAVMHDIMRGDATSAQIGGLLIGLRVKGETVAEIAAAARVMRNYALAVEVDHPHLVDIVGTGGDGTNTFNISTTSAFVVAAAGGVVAKHNNRSVSSRSGSADVLEAAGVHINLDPTQVRNCIERLGIGFMFAPAHHGATRHAAAPRRELGVRTLFNLLGPLTNPARVPNQLVGVFNSDWIGRVARALQKLGGRHVMVVHSEDGLDEISISAPTRVAELRDGVIHEHVIDPRRFGLAMASLDTITVNTVAESLARMLAVLDNEPGPERDIVLLNAGAAIHVAGVAADMAEGVARAADAMRSGAARQKLEQLAALTRSMGQDGES